MAKFPEATTRLYYRVYICKRCKTKMKSDPQRVVKKKLTCRGCGGHSFRAVRVKK